MIQYSYTFDPETRTLTPSGDPVNVKGDTNVVQIVFTMPASYEGLALSSYVWRVFYKIAMNTKLEEVRFHQFTDQTTEGENLVLTWTVTNSVTEFAVHLGFALSGTLTDTGGNVTNRINSIPAYERIEPTIGGGSYTEDDAEIEGIKDFLVGIQEAAEAAQAAAETAAAEAEASAARAEQIADELEPYKSLAIVESASGDPATFTDGSNGVPMKSVSVGIEPVQSGSGDPSPDNVRPISGWDEVKVTRCGKNLFDPSGYGAYKTGENAYTATLTQINTIRFNIPRILLNREITFSAHVGSLGTGITSLRVQAIVGDTIYNGNSYNTGGSGYSKITFTPTSESDVVKFTYGSGGPSSVSFSDLQLEVGAERTDYEPYTTQTYPISLTSAGTVYGGTLDVVSGELVVDRKMANFDGTESWGTEVVQNVRSFYLLLSNANKMTDRKSGALYSDLLSNEFVGTNVTGAGQVYVSSGGYLNCRTNDNFTDVETWKSFLASNPLQVVYPLATPLTYTLTPTQITSLLGTNHVWAECGEVAVEYVADTKMYIDKIVASL